MADRKPIWFTVACAALSACTAQPPTPEWARFRGTPEIQPLTVRAIASPAAYRREPVAVIVPLDTCAVLGAGAPTASTVRAGPLQTKAPPSKPEKRRLMASHRRAPMGPDL